ncbi:Pectate lyase superfamily protein [Pseudarcicella hirudinis]|uniref:Pectate lyase superfamily protein n=2 Tax=Pseudarcicella hirudinis TaxID=1079859 RepID=A0A1I5MI36_9BACT|nr:right-handed parallel beta-helix repeat-containing protein [Pseudarcicella hirudinis]SFP08977.1 Pectate lyase superfamily protein [Pseudarcicella hirudinis]
MIKQFAVCQLLVLSFGVKAQSIDVTTFGAKPDSFADATESVQKAIDSGKNKAESVIEFPKGRYDFWPDKAVATTYYISNSSSAEEMPVKRQSVGLMFKGLKNITLDGNGSTFVFHGKMIAWALDSSENITIKNLKVNYERPGMSEMTIKEITSESVTASIHPDSKFKIIEGRLEWYGERWVTKNHHAVLLRVNKDMLVYSSWSPFLKSKAELIAPLTVRFNGDFSKFQAEPGDVLTIRDTYRDYVGSFQNRSKNIRLLNVHMNSMHGLGIVSQFCENLNYDSVFVEPEKGSGRVIASSADGMHFSGCRGQITINNCRFNGMHDDPVNVHGTHLKIIEIVSPTSLKLRFMHPQSYGFLPFVPGDTVAYVHSASLQIFGQEIVRSAKMISEHDVLVELQKPLADNVSVGDVLENITWTPALTIKNSRFERTNTRGTLVTTRRKVLIENNVYYRTGMHAILIENDASGWYESGEVTDVTIRNNQFIECGFNSAPGNYIININPQDHEPARGYYVHKNITIENNLFKIYDFPILFARSTNGLRFLDNTIEKSEFLPADKLRAAFSFAACTNVKISGNKFYSGAKTDIKLDKMEKKDIFSKITPVN